LDDVAVAQRPVARRRAVHERAVARPGIDGALAVGCGDDAGVVARDLRILEDQAVVGGSPDAQVRFELDGERHAARLANDDVRHAAIMPSIMTSDIPRPALRVPLSPWHDARMRVRQLLDIGSFTWTYLLIDDGSGEAVLVDPVYE